MTAPSVCFSRDAREIFEHFRFDEFIGQLDEANLLFKVVQKVATTFRAPRQGRDRIATALTCGRVAPPTSPPGAPSGARTDNHSLNLWNA